MKKYLIVSLCVAVFGGLLSAQAAVVAEYTFDEDGGSASVASTDTETDTTASAFGSGAGFSLVQTLGAIIGATEGSGVDDGGTDDLADAITQNQYFTFTVAAVGDATFDLTSFAFDYGRWLNGAQDFYLFSSVDGFSVGDELLKVNAIGTESQRFCSLEFNE